MGRKKRRGTRVKPFCYYCDRGFDDEKVLIQHQKAKHFKCGVCCRKLDTATGLAVHLMQVHKEQLGRVPNSLTGRDSVDVIVHGMEGIPHEIISEKLKKEQQRHEGKATQKRQRLNWAQVTMAPASLEQFIQMAQQGMLPSFSGVPSVPLGGELSAPVTPQTAPSLPTPPTLQGLLNPNVAAPLSVPPPMGMSVVAPGILSLVTQGPNSSQSPGMYLNQQSQMVAQNANANHSPGLAAPTPPPPLYRGAAGPPGAPPIFSTPALPPNTRLMYADDSLSVEEKRFMEIQQQCC